MQRKHQLNFAPIFLSLSPSLLPSSHSAFSTALYLWLSSAPSSALAASTLSLIPAPSPLPLLAAQQSKWVFSGCYDLRDDNGSYNVASRSWCGWACGGFCCVRPRDGARERGGRKAGPRPSANHHSDSTSFSSSFFLPPPHLSFSPLAVTFSGPVVFLWW